MLICSAVLAGRTSALTLEETVKMVDVLKSGFQGGLFDCDRIIAHQIFGLGKPGLYEFFLGRTVEEILIIDVELALSDIQDLT